MARQHQHQPQNQRKIVILAVPLGRCGNWWNMEELELRGTRTLTERFLVGPRSGGHRVPNRGVEENEDNELAPGGFTVTIAGIAPPLRPTGSFS